MFDNFKVANYPKSLVSPELYARPLSKLFSGDVIDGFTVTPGTGLQVVLAPGNAMIRYGSAAVASARIASLVANFNLTIETADVSNPRIDLVVLYIDNAVNLPDGTPSAAHLDGKGVAKAKIVKGTAAATPAAPNATAIQSSVGAGNPYTVLAQVRVNAGVSVIAANQITDVRDLARTSKTDWATISAGAYSGALTGVSGTSTTVPLSGTIVAAKAFTKSANYLQAVVDGAYQAAVSFTATANGLGILQVHVGSAGTTADPIVGEFGVGVSNERGGGACIFPMSAGQRVSFSFRSPAGTSNLTAINLGVVRVA